MKILLATSKASLTSGGIASYNYELLRILGKRNQMFLITDSDEHDIPGYEKTLSLHGIDIHSFNECKKLLESINADEFDLIINSRSSLMPILAPFVNAPVISVAHFVNGFQADNAGYNSEYQSSIIALSNYGKQYIDNKFSIADKEKVKVVYNFVADSSSTFNEKKVKREVPVIVYPGGASRHKGFDFVMLAVYRLLKENIRFKFYWLGGETLPVNQLSLFRFHYIHQFFKPDDRLVITGQIPRAEAEQIIGDANIFLLPSRGEGCPMTLLEAMREGCIPVISDAKHGSLELIQMLGCGDIVKKCNGYTIYKHLKQIIEHIDEFRDCYKNTYEFSKKDLSQKVWEEQMNQIIILSSKNKKIVEQFTRNRFVKSRDGYLKLYKRGRRKIQIEGLRIRIKLEICYLLNRIHLLSRL
jgi:glycosyltransferase involved in cell wall biosynthesis